MIWENNRTHWKWMWCFDVCSISFNTIPHIIPHIHSCVCERNTQQWWLPSHHIHHSSPTTLNNNTITHPHISKHTPSITSHIFVCVYVCVLNSCWLTNGNQSIIHTIQSFLPIQNYQPINGWMVVCVECDDCSKQHKHWMWCVCGMVQKQMGDGCVCDGVVVWVLWNKWEEWMSCCECEWFVEWWWLSVSVCSISITLSMSLLGTRRERLLMWCEPAWNEVCYCC